jgi:hypothetical protein
MRPMFVAHWPGTVDGCVTRLDRGWYSYSEPFVETWEDFSNRYEDSDEDHDCDPIPPMPAVD